MKANLLFSILITLSLTSSSQSGPAGVGTSATNGLWLKVDAGTSTTTDGVGISSWVDQSGNGNTVSQPAANQQPLYRTNILNGVAAIQFDNNNGTNDKLQGLDASSLDNTTGITIFTVTRPTNLDGGARSIISKRTNVGVNQAYMFFYFTGNYIHTDVVTNNDRFDTNPTTFANNNNYILDMIYDGSLAAANRCKVYSGETLIKTATETSASIPDYPSPLLIGSTHDTDPRPFGGYISEVILYTEALNTAKRIIVNNYLSSKYDINLAANDFYLGDTPGNGNFDKWVAGIGQVDATNTQIRFNPSASQGMGLTNLSGFDNGDFVLSGHNLTTNNNIYTDISVVSGGPVLARWERIWYIDVTNTSATILTDVVFDLSDGGFTGTPTTATNYVLLYRAVNSGNWTIAATGSSVAGDQITFANYPFASNANDGFYTIGTLSFSSTLPIELISFDAYLNNGTVALEWQTASELNNDYFTIERSSNGNDFEPIINVDGAGNSNHIINYFETDYSPLAGASYYRLRQVDYDGRSSWSQIENVKPMGNSEEILLYPNPTDGLINIILNDFSDEHLMIEFSDITGRICYQFTLNPHSNPFFQSHDLKYELAAGSYVVTFATKSKFFTQKLIVK
jgi:hypothetical protein